MIGRRAAIQNTMVEKRLVMQHLWVCVLLEYLGDGGHASAIGSSSKVGPWPPWCGQAQELKIMSVVKKIPMVNLVVSVGVGAAR